MGARTVLAAGLEPRGRLLAVHAHPDDETLAMGGLLATWAAAGQPVTVVTCTRGERGETIGDDLRHLEGDGAALADHRQVELVAALRALGVTEHAFLDELPLDRTSCDDAPAGRSPGGRGSRYEDSGMAWTTSAGVATGAPDVPQHAFVRVPVEEAAARLAGLVVRERPSAVVTYEPGGGYGHPDHVQAHEVTVRALALCGGFRPQHVWWRVETSAAHRDDVAALRRRFAAGVAPEPGRGTGHGHREALRLPEPPGRGDRLPSVVRDDLSVDLVVDVAPVRDAVLAALRAHRSQVQAVSAWQSPGEPGGPLGSCALSNGELLPLSRYERYHEAGVEPSAAPSGER